MKVRLKQVRMSRGLSQNKLAQLVNMTLQNIQKIEYGKTKGLQYDALNKLCKVLDCQPGDLLVYEPDEDTQEATVKQEELKQLELGTESTGITSPDIQYPTHSLLAVFPTIPESDIGLRLTNVAMYIPDDEEVA